MTSNSDKLKGMMKDTIVDMFGVERVELIDQYGRVFITHNAQSVGFSVQDNGKTLKLFITEKP